MVVDDFHVLTHTFVALIADAIPGIQVCGFTSARAALEAIKRDRWRIAVLDMDLGDPELTGLDLRAALDHRTRVVLISGAIPKELPTVAALERADRYFLKPVQADDLIGAIRELLHD